VTYSLVMIVRDGAADLPRSLAAARPYISHWTICDTGSTDGSQDIIRAALDGIPGTLNEDEWRDFGQNRSLALERARGTADWLLLMDADMAVTIEPGFVPDPAVEAYMLEMGDHTAFSYRLPLLVRGDLPWRSVGAVHEYTALPDRAYLSAPTDQVRVDMGGEYRGSPEKYQWHAGMLERALDSRTVFYLGQTYASLGRSDEARALFRSRAVLSGFAEEAYYAAYRAAMLAPWPEQAAELMAAWEMRPSRLEALHDLVRGLNQRGLHRAAYALASLPTAPCGDVLFVSRDVWDWGMKFERSIAAWWVGERAESLALCDELLANPRLPDHIRALVVKNRAFAA
jgi:hypothetical protein